MRDHGATWVVIRGRGLPSLTLAFALSGATGCKYTFEVFPSFVQVDASGATSPQFTVYTRLRKPDGTVVDAPVSWQVTTGDPMKITVSPAGRSTYAVSVTGPTARGTEFDLRFSAKGKDDVLTIVTTGPSPPNNDVAKAMASPGMPPSVVAMLGNQGGCPSDSTFSFVGAAELGQWRSPCTSEVVAFTSYQPPKRWKAMAWQATVATADLVDALPANALSPLALTQVKVKVWLIGAATDAGIDNELATANAIFETSGVGVQLQRDAVTGQITSAASVSDCVTLQDVVLAGIHPDPLAVNVYVSVGTFRGVTCRRKDRPLWPIDVVLVSEDNRLETTVTHEHAHVFGLIEPWGPGSNQYFGHTGTIKGFATDNLMWAPLSDQTPISRRRLSLGQVYRIHFDKASWLVPTGTGTDCGCDPYQSACGRLSRDVRPIADDVGTVATGVCP